MIVLPRVPPSAAPALLLALSGVWSLLGACRPVPTVVRAASVQAGAEPVGDLEQVATVELRGPSAGPDLSGIEEALLRAADHLARQPDGLPLDPDRHPPCLESYLRDADGLRVQYRQELEMAYGTLVAVYRGVLEWSGPRVEPLHRVLDGPAPSGWSRLPRCAPVPRRPAGTR